MPIREDEEIALPISEEFARFLFGPDAGPILRNDPRAAGAGPGDVAGYWPLSAESIHILNVIGNEVVDDYRRAHPITEIVTGLDKFSPSRLGIQIVGYPRGRGSRGILDQVAIAFIYGKWDELGPRMVLKWLIDNPRTRTAEIVKKYMKGLESYNRYRSGSRSVNKRMRNAKQSMREYNTAKEELEARGIPENVTAYVLSPMMRNKTNKSAPLSRLVKNKRGGSRRRTRRRQHS